MLHTSHNHIFQHRQTLLFESSQIRAGAIFATQTARELPVEICEDPRLQKITLTIVAPKQAAETRCPVNLPFGKQT